MNLHDRWRRFVDEVLKSTELHDRHHAYIRGLHAVREEDGVLTVTPENELMVMVVGNVLPELQEALGTFWDHPAKLELVYDAATVATVKCSETEDDDLPLFSRPMPSAPAPTPAPTVETPRRASRREPEYGSPLDADMRLDNFLADSSNDEAFFAANAFSNKDGTRFNPLYIHGVSGTGKTHLLTGIGNAIKARNPDTPVLFFNGDEFITLVIDHIRQQRMQLFRRGTQLKGAVVLVDDVQMLSGKTQSLQELFNLFNWHTARGARLAFTSDLPPDQIKGLPERLRSRVSSGLVVGVEPPLFETRVAIAQSAGETLSRGRYPLNRDVAELISEIFANNTRDLVAAVRRLQLRAEFRSVPKITMGLAQEIFGEVRARQLHRSPEQIARKLAELLTVDFNSLTGKSRTRRLVEARIWIAGIVRELTNASQMEIGQLLGRDHTTINHTLKRYNDIVASQEGRMKRDAFVRTLQREIG